MADEQNNNPADTTPTEKPRRWAIDGVPVWQFALRALMVAAMVIVAFWFSQRGDLFFYQGF